MSPTRYFLVQHDDAWMIKFADEEFGPYKSKSEAMLFAVEAARKLTERGTDTEVCLMGENGFFHAEWSNAQPAGGDRHDMRTDISITDRIGNGIVAGFIATLVMSALHEPVALVTAAVGMHAPAPACCFTSSSARCCGAACSASCMTICPGRRGCAASIFAARARRSSCCS